MLEVDSAQGASDDPLVGRVLLDRFRIKEVLGEGGMGKVYLASQKLGSTTREVAVKTLHPELSSDPQLVARFHRECDTVIQLHSPNTVKFYDFGELEDKTLFIAMELIEGEDLAKRLERGALPPDVIDKLLIQICDSLAEAHEMGVVHRDLKPENVLLTDRAGRSDFVKVLDFGIAKRSEAEDQASAKLTKQGMVLGTPPYMSPEQFSGMTLDRRSDIYSLGMMTYEMVVGQLPFEANTPWEWATRHLTTEPQPIESHPQGSALPEHKRVAIMRALAKNPDHRQSTVTEFMQEFTGMSDPQQAWTMATSSGVRSSGAHTTGSTGRMAIGTPQPSSSSQPGTQPFTTDPMAATAYNMPGVPTPPHGNTGPMGAYSTGGMPAQTGSFPLGKVIAGLALALLIVGGAAGGTIYLLLREPAEVASHNPASATVVDPAGPTTNGIPSTPTSMDPPEPSNTDGEPSGAGAVAATPTAAMTETPTAMEPAPSAMTGTPSTMQAEPAEEPTSAMTATAMTSAMVTRMTNMSEMDRPTRMTGGDRSGGEAALRRGQSALSANDLSGAIAGLRQAQRSLGRNDSDVRALRNSLGRRASNKVGILMQQGRCRPAQALFRDLRSVGASGPSSRHFSDDWCPRP